MMKSKEQLDAEAQGRLLNPTKAQIKYRNRLWADALLKNKRKSRNQMKCPKGGRCCLRVAQDVAVEQGLQLAYDEAGQLFIPHGKIAHFFGWKTLMTISGCPATCRIPLLRRGPDTTILADAAHLNDYIAYKGKRKGLPHKLIAECVLNTYVHPSKPKWSFAL